ncbi:MAG TPA: Cache 3/Cache 2 fusion domain-containing protein, partial [Roseiarcus sp.]|nr:Cache 3/Cache 2 fusion domain-containing protein [Roseiarcus sp.]
KREEGQWLAGDWHSLDPNGPVIVKIRAGEPFYGDVNILGKPYVTGYEPIRDSAKNVIGIYFVGYAK